MFKTVITGRVGMDAESKLVNEKYVTSFNVVHNERWRDKEGNKVEVPHWVKCKKWTLADNFAKHIKAGDIVTVVGLIETEAWMKDGEPTSGLTMNVREFEFVWSKNKSSGSSSEPANPAENGDKKEDDLPF